MAKEVGIKMTLKRCTEYIVIPKSDIDDWSFETDRHVYCGRIDGHDGVHSFYHNGKKVKKNE